MLAIPETEEPGPLYRSKDYTSARNIGSDKATEADWVKRWLKDLPPGTMCAFSDGSSNGPGRSAFSFAIYRNEELITTEKGSLLGGEVFDAEIVGALRALEATLKIVRNMPMKVFWTTKRLPKL
ncbi:hypothetical protein K3495_g8041 [Podosphaera aphanis]|nr:hypothetical protein K3495_g8041 [Podosphaera aphanis]